MTSHRPTLIRFGHALPTDSSQADALLHAFDVIEVDSNAALEEALARHPDALVLRAPPAPRGNGALDPLTILEHTGEGLGLVEAAGDVVWSTERLRGQNETTRKRFVKRCQQALETFNETYRVSRRDSRQMSQRYTFTVGRSSYEVVVSPARIAAGADRPVRSVVGVLYVITATKQLQDKLRAIDAAGSELIKIEPAMIARMNMAERLKLLEEKMVRYVKELLKFDNFEIRLIDRETNQLELVIAVGIAPLKVGEVIFAEAKGNGISGYVAASGKSYLCHDVQADPRYREGLDNAGSSLTVPLRLHDRIIGVFNVESYATNVFDEQDRQFAEIFGRYIAMAMNILDLLVLERFTTNEQIAENVLGELSQPLGEITTQAEALRNELVGEEHLRKTVDALVEAASQLQGRVRSCMSGPRTILGADQAMQQSEPDPVLYGKRILIADDEQIIRDTLEAILTRRGCTVTVCADGIQTIERLTSAQQKGTHYDMVISDIRMPGGNGYEVFRTARAIREDTPVILMTGFGYDPHHSIVRAREEGLHAFLFKPFNAGQMLEIVMEAFVGAQR